MISYICLKKYRGSDGNISLYELQDSRGNKLRVHKDELKKQIKSGCVHVENLTLTKDNRLIDKKQQEFKVSRKGREMESYIDLNRRIRRQEKSAKQQLKGRIENLNYLSITDKNNQYIGFIYTREIDEMLTRIEKLYSRINIKESMSVIAEEIYYTCSIEGANTTIKRTEQIMQGSKPQNYSEQMVENSYKATKYLNLIKQGSYLTENELFTLWNYTTQDACDNREIQGKRYRIGNNQVGTYVPPEYQYVEELMQKYFAFMHDTGDGINTLIKAAILHYYFVFIHPFCDGNGRTTRLLSVDYLIRSGFDKFKAISLSKEIKRTVLDYQKALINSENDYNDITFFIEYYLTVIQNTLEDIFFSL